MKKVKQSFEDAFGIVPTSNDTQITKAPPSQTNEHYKEDYELGRNELRDLIGTGKTALEDALTAVASTQDPKAISAFAQLLKAQSDVIGQLMKHQEAYNGASKPTSAAPKVVKNEANFYYGTTEDMLKMMDES